MAIRSVVKGKKKPVKKENGNTDYSEIGKLIKPVSNVEQPMTALIYGKSGTGKTALSSTFPRSMLLLDIREKGTETIANEEDIDVIKVDDWATFEKTYWFLKAGKHSYETVVLDQISALQGVAMDYVREEEGLDASDKLHKGQWGTISGMMQNWLLSYRDLRDDGLNVVFIAHDRMRGGEDEDTDDGQIAPNVGARLMPSVSGFVNGMVSVIGNTFIRERYKKLEGGGKKRIVEYCLRVGPHAYYDTKIRRPKDAGPIPEAIVNPSYKKLLAISRGEDIDVVKKATKVKR